MSDPFKPGVAALERFSKQQQKNAGKPSKDVWARTHLPELVAFWQTWQTRQRSKYGAIEDVIAVTARRKSLPFDPDMGITVVFVRIVLGFDRRKASTWAKVIDAVKEGRLTLAEVAEKGIAVSAYGERQVAKPPAQKTKIRVTRKGPAKPPKIPMKQQPASDGERRETLDEEYNPFDADDDDDAF